MSEETPLEEVDATDPVDPAPDEVESAPDPADDAPETVSEAIEEARPEEADTATSGSAPTPGQCQSANIQAKNRRKYGRG